MYTNNTIQQANVTFPTAYSRPPNVQLSKSGFATGCLLALGAVTATGFSYSSTNTSGSSQTFTSTWVVTWTAKPYSLDVSGSVNATGIAVGGSVAKQIDCGYSSGVGSATITVNFNFTFTNVPKVVATLLWSHENQMYSLVVMSVSTTGFTAYSNVVNSGSSSVGAYGLPFNWIAIG